MYYIYHIPGVKIGCSKEPAYRVAKQGYTQFDVLEVHSDIYEVSDREIELQKEYNYTVDPIPYWQSLENRYKLTAENRHPIWKDVNHQKNAGRASANSPNHVSKQKVTCQYCGKVNIPGNHKRWHGDNCKLSPSSDVYESR